VDELTVALSGLALQAKQLTSVNARETANKEIKRLQCITDQLSKEGMHFASPCMCSYLGMHARRHSLK